MGLGYEEAIIDHSKTKAYSFMESIIYINKKEKKSISSALIQEMKKIKNIETGQPLITEIYPKKEIFSGPYMEKVPDIVFIADDMRCRVTSSFKGEVFTKINWGQHSIYGTLILNGKMFSNIKEIKEAGIKDITPTILYSLKIDIPSDIDGKNLRNEILLE